MSPTKSAPSVSIENIMVTNVHSLNLNMKLWEVAEFLIKNRISGAPILDNSRKIISVLGEGGVLRLAASEGLEATVLHCLSRLPSASKLITLKRHSDFTEAYRIFISHNVHRIPIIDDEFHLLGIVSRGTILRMFIEAHYQKRLPPGV